MSPGDRTPRGFDNSGLVFPNDRKKQPQQPDYRGQCVINGVGYWIAGWKKNGKKGPFMALSFTLQEEERKAAPKPPYSPPRSSYPPQPAPPSREPGSDDEDFP